jgi:hypothetical protein
MSIQSACMHQNHWPNKRPGVVGKFSSPPTLDHPQPMTLCTTVHNIPGNHCACSQLAMHSGRQCARAIHPSTKHHTHQHIILRQC